MTTYTKYLPILLTLSTTTTALITAPTNKHQKHRRYSIAKLQQPRPSSCWSRARADSTSTILYQAKDNDRARMEKSWENMMGEGKLCVLWGFNVSGLDLMHILCIFFDKLSDIPLTHIYGYIPLYHIAILQ